jgi:hypothetical protein
VQPELNVHFAGGAEILGEAACSFRKSQPGEIGAFDAGILQRSVKVCAPPTAW